MNKSKHFQLREKQRNLIFNFKDIKVWKRITPNMAEGYAESYKVILNIRRQVLVTIFSI